MQLRKDLDLAVLENASREDLDVLHSYLVFDGKGKERVLTQLPDHKRWKAHHPNHEEYWDLIGAELQLFGGNTVVNFARGNQGVPYREILIDVCKRTKVNFNKAAPVEIIEQALLFKILTDSIERMTPKERRDLANVLGINAKDLTPQALMGALQVAISAAGFGAYKVAVILANAMARLVLGRGLTFAGNAALTKLVGAFAGPVGWILTGLWTALDLAGPAYRVTIPACIQVAYIRAKAAERR